ncbi:MAG: BrxE family protein [Desulfobacterales bacterium]|nr:BrxE family protein [Desulfobacterales bacterium]
MTTKNETQKPQLPLLILHLRAVVLALGESASTTWWKTEFMNETGLRVLGSSVSADDLSSSGPRRREGPQVTLGRVGRVSVYHLFRLPESLGNRTPSNASDPAEDFFPSLRNAVGRPEELMKLLIPMCGGERADSAREQERSAPTRTL